MKRTISLTLVFVLMLSAFMLAACKSGDGKDALNTTTPPTATATATATASAEPTAEPETEAPTADPHPRPDPVTIEWLAGEMQRRYYAGCVNFELADYSDIMDRNEDTDLYFWDNQLEIDGKIIHQEERFISVTTREAYVKRVVNETETEITVDAYVLTDFTVSDPDMNDFIGMDFQITVDKQRMVIISYSEPDMCATRYNSWLSWLASNYRKEGLSWQEANKKAYEDIYTTYVDSAAEYEKMKQAPQS